MPTARTLAKTVFAGADHLFPNPEGPRILIYHQVGSNLGRQMEVDTECFVEQIELLIKEYEVVHLADAIERWDEPGSERLVVLSFDDGYMDTYTTAFPLMLERGMPFTIYLATQQIEAAGVESPDSASLTWEQTGEMIGSGLATVGAHTHTHLDLRSATHERIVSEVKTSNDLIERRLGQSVKHFAYPWGYWSLTAQPVISDTYDSATLGGSPRTKRPFDPHRLPRYPVQLSDGFRFFRQRLEGGLLTEEWLRRRLRGYTGP